MFSELESNMPSYSSLLQQIEAGKVESLVLIPLRREVHVYYKDGKTAKVSILPNDQRLLRIVQSSSTPLTVKDIRKEEALASFTASFTVIFIFIILLSIVFNKYIKLATKSLSFLSHIFFID